MWRRYENIVAIYQPGNSSKIMCYPICLPFNKTKNYITTISDTIETSTQNIAHFHIVMSLLVESMICQTRIQWRAFNIPYVSASNTLASPYILWLRPIINWPFSFLITIPNAKYGSPSLTEASTLSFTHPVSGGTHLSILPLQNSTAI